MTLSHGVKNLGMTDYVRSATIKATLGELGNPPILKHLGKKILVHRYAYP